MAKLLETLLQLQSVERQLVQVRRRLQIRGNAVANQERKVRQLRADYEALHQKSLNRRKDADRLELDLKTKEAEVAKYRTALNTTKTNKEYAAILTQINTCKADNVKYEEEALRVLQEVDTINADAQKIQDQIQVDEKRLQEIRQGSAQEIEKLTAMVQDLQAKRGDAAKEVPPEALRVFERASQSYEGEGMAVIEIHGARPPHDYVCGGCYMGLNPEHANALQTRDEIRTCDNCKRILYMEVQTNGSASVKH